MLAYRLISSIVILSAQLSRRTTISSKDIWSVELCSCPQHPKRPTTARSPPRAWQQQQHNWIEVARELC